MMKKVILGILAILGLIVVLPVALGLIGAFVGLAVKLLTLVLMVAIPALLVLWLLRALTRDRSVPAAVEPEPDYAGPHAGRLRRIDYRLRRLEDIILTHTRQL